MKYIPTYGCLFQIGFNFSDFFEKKERLLRGETFYPLISASRPTSNWSGDIPASAYCKLPYLLPAPFLAIRNVTSKNAYSTPLNPHFTPFKLSWLCSSPIFVS